MDFFFYISLNIFNCMVCSIHRNGSIYLNLVTQQRPSAYTDNIIMFSIFSWRSQYLQYETYFF